MRKILILSLLVALGAFLIVSNPALGEEGEDRGPIWGVMQAEPATDNALGEVITLQVKVYWDKDRVEFDHRQIPKKIKLSPFEVREADHVTKKSGKYTVDIWEFKIQCLVGSPPMEYKISSVPLQYEKKGVSYTSYFDIPGTSISFRALTSEDSLPDPIIRKLPFGPKENLVPPVLFALAGLFVLTGIGLGIFFLLKKRQRERKQPLESPPADEFISRYEYLHQSLKQGENVLKVLHKLYLLLRSFYKERRGIKLKIGWEVGLNGEERLIIRELQSLYGNGTISKPHAHELLEKAGNILRGG